MTAHDKEQDSPERQEADGELPFRRELENSLQLGEHMLACLTGLIDLARTELQLAIQSIPKLMMMWLLMMPILLLTWCSFSVLVAWIVYDMSDGLGFGLFVFFLLQLLLLLVCRLFYKKYCARMTLPITREHVNAFMRTLNYGSSNASKVEK